MRSVCLLVLWSCSAALSPAKPQVVTTHTVLADLVSVVAGERAEVKCLLPVTLDPHSYEPKPADIRLLSRADLVVINGFGLEPWAEKVIANSGFHGALIKAAEGAPHLLKSDPSSETEEMSHPQGHYDPHAWHDPENVKHYVAAIRDALSKISPENAAEFQANTASYSEKLDALNREAQAQFATIPPDQRKLVTSHDSLRYLAAAYGLSIRAVAGSRPDQEPSARQLAQLIASIRREHVRAVFFEATTNPKLAELVAREGNVRVVEQLYTDSLGAPGSLGATYLEMFRANVETIVRALK